MDGIFGMIDGSFKLSIVDSTMMLIVHRAMDKAHQRVKSKEGVIERLHEISKFYELSVMQLDGCIKFVQEETDTHNTETSHEEVLAGLAEIRNRLQRRLYESELAILQKDRELADRSESEVKLRQALEITERELVSSQEDLELERSRSAGSSNLSPHEGEDDENRDGEFGEVKEKLEFGDDYEPKVKTKRNRCTNDVIRVEEMGSDIDILKETLDIAFGKMHSAILISEMGAIEQQVKSSIENDIISILLKGFVKDCQEDLEEEVTRKEKQVSANKRWSDLLNEVIGLFEDLKPVIGQNEMQSRECNILDFESIIKKKSTEVEPDQWNPEMLHDKTSMSLSREESAESLKRRFQEILEKLENSMILNATVNKIIDQNEDFNEEDIPLEKGEQIFVENHRQKSDVDTLADVWGKMHQLQDEENSGIQNQICALRQEREDREFQNMMKEETYITLFQGLREKFCDDLSCWELEILISDGICRDLIRNMFNQLDDTMKSNHIEAKIKDDVYRVVFKETMEDYCSINDLGLDRLQECKIKKSSILELHNMELNKSDSKSLKLMELPHITYDFELMANRKLETIMLRLEEMKHTLDPLPQVMASLQEDKSLYKKAFIRRCQNLRKAENEVDILGDQVDILVSLIEKIYSILNQQSPALQQYFDVSEILRSIEEEVPVIVCTPPEKLDTSPDVQPMTLHRICLDSNNEIAN